MLFCAELTWKPEGSKKAHARPLSAPNTWVCPSKDNMISPPGNATIAALVSFPIAGRGVCSPVSASSNKYLQPSKHVRCRKGPRTEDATVSRHAHVQDDGHICRQGTHWELKTMQMVLPPIHCMATGLCATATSFSSTKSEPS